jgi:hypothetical protein
MNPRLTHRGCHQRQAPTSVAAASARGEIGPPKRKGYERLLRRPPYMQAARMAVLLSTKRIAAQSRQGGFPATEAERLYCDR